MSETAIDRGEFNAPLALMTIAPLYVPALRPEASTDTCTRTLANGLFDDADAGENDSQFEFDDTVNGMSTSRAAFHTETICAAGLSPPSTAVNARASVEVMISEPDGVGIGVAIGIGVATPKPPPPPPPVGRVGVGVGVRVGIGVGMTVGVVVAVGVGMTIGVVVAVGVGMTMGVDVAVGVGMTIGVVVALGVGMTIGVDVAVGVGVGGGAQVGPRELIMPMSHAWKSASRGAQSPPVFSSK